MTDMPEHDAQAYARASEFPDAQAYATHVTNARTDADVVTNAESFSNASRAGGPKDFTNSEDGVTVNPEVKIEERSNEEVTLAQIVAALSVTYTPVGVMYWLSLQKARGAARDLGQLAAAVRRIGDADPSDFAVTDRSAVLS